MGVSGRLGLVLWNFKIWMYFQEHFPIVTQGLPVFESCISPKEMSSTVIMLSDCLLLLIFTRCESDQPYFPSMCDGSEAATYSVLHNTYIFLLIISVCERIYDSLWDGAVPELFLFCGPFSGDLKFSLCF